MLFFADFFKRYCHVSQKILLVSFAWETLVKSKPPGLLGPILHDSAHAAANVPEIQNPARTSLLLDQKSSLIFHRPPRRCPVASTCLAHIWLTVARHHDPVGLHHNFHNFHLNIGPASSWPQAVHWLHDAGFVRRTFHVLVAACSCQPCGC